MKKRTKHDTGPEAPDIGKSLATTGDDVCSAKDIRPDLQLCFARCADIGQTLQANFDRYPCGKAR